MTLRTGIDLCEIRRMVPQLERQHFLDRVLTPGEQGYLQGKGACRAETLAGLWAAKEAVLKALGTGLSLPMTDVEICHDEDGAPRCCLAGKAAELAGNASISVSISHEAGIAAAVCVMLLP